MARFRADANHDPYLPLVAEYFTHQARRPGKLPVTDAMIIAARAGGTAHIPSSILKARLLHGDSVPQVTDAQLQAEDPSFPYVSASDVQLTGIDLLPRPLTVPEIKEYISLRGRRRTLLKRTSMASRSTVYRKCFAFPWAHAYRIFSYQRLPHPPVLHDEVLNRMDEYGGSVENRARFSLGIIRDMAMRDPIPTFSYVASQLAQRHPTWHKYLRLVEPRIVRTFSRDEDSHRAASFARGHTRKMALKWAEESDDLIAFVRYFTSKPGLVTRIEKDIPFKLYDCPTFYLAGDFTPRGYATHAFANET
ncbi:putative inactive dehydrogenase EasA [Favolaschia claudopus]|uniref:Inactive dehydrogenase EasA n=1 Tax=Favolaschia claudopus TaxID=2862362 RepID=A0AAW0C0N4_9AGAR